MTDTITLEAEIKTIKARIEELDSQLPSRAWKIEYTYLRNEDSITILTTKNTKTTKVYAATEDVAHMKIQRLTNNECEIIRSYELKD